MATTCWTEERIMGENRYLLGIYYAVLLTIIRGAILCAGAFIQLYVIHLKIVLGALANQPSTFIFISLMFIGAINIFSLAIFYPVAILFHFYQIIIMIIGGVNTDFNIGSTFVVGFGWEDTYRYKINREKEIEKERPEWERRKREREEQARQYWEYMRREEEFKARAFYQQFKEEFKRDFGDQVGAANHEEVGLPKTFAEACAVLGVGTGLTKAEYKAAYRKKALEYHSDQYQGAGEKIRKVAEEEMKRINAAWDIIQREMPG